MLKQTIALLVLVIVLLSCTRASHENSFKCNSVELDKSIKYNDLILDMDEGLIKSSPERPDKNGALGRNKADYFHVRFQMNMTKLTDYAIRFESVEAITEFVKNLRYSFVHQKEEGGFELNPPEKLRKILKPASRGDIVSGTAFFAYSLGMSLYSLRTSHWYNKEDSLKQEHISIEAFRPNVQRMLDYLKRNVSQLEVIDEKAPNRLLFDAIAFYSLGDYLNDNEAIEMGLAFAESALKQMEPVQGYFIEGGGWDSSYNGVATKLAMELYTLIDADIELKKEIGRKISCAVDWQRSRILNSGKISTQGNTRVFPGGESFMGKEKGVDVEKTIKAFFYMSILTSDKSYKKLAKKVFKYYRP